MDSIKEFYKGERTPSIFVLGSDGLSIGNAVNDLLYYQGDAYEYYST